MKLPREFYQQDALSLAQQLVGQRLVRQMEDGVTAGLIVETEAYLGAEDPAAHSYKNRRTARTAIQYGPGGFAYVYLIYGMHCCFNVTANTPDKPEMVLIRALQPVIGLPLMEQRRGQNDAFSLCSGPGKLCQAMDITRKLYGTDLCGDELFLEDAGLSPEIVASERVNIDYAGDAARYPWRFLWKNSPYVSLTAEGRPPRRKRER